MATAGPDASDDPWLPIPGQSKDFPVEIPLSREHSPVESTTSSWVNLDSHSSRPSGSGRERASAEASVQEKLKQLEWTVSTLQAQLQAPQSSTPKITAFYAFVELHFCPSYKKSGLFLFPPTMKFENSSVQC